MFLTTNHHTLVFIQTVPRKKFISYVKRFGKTPILKLFFHHWNCKTYFLQKIVCQLLWSPLLCPNLLVEDINPVTLGKPNVIYQQGYLQTDTKSHILQHLNENPNCRDLCDDSYFIIIDQTSSSFRLKMKDALHITWLKIVLIIQKNHVSIRISIWCKLFPFTAF